MEPVLVLTFLGYLKRVKLVHQTILMLKLRIISKTDQYVAPDEMFVGYTRKYSMAVWTGYSNRLTPIVGDGFRVAGSIYRSMMEYLAENDHLVIGQCLKVFIEVVDMSLKMALAITGRIQQPNNPQQPPAQQLKIKIQ